jgi:hypothetical protein
MWKIRKSIWCFEPFEGRRREKEVKEKRNRLIDRIIDNRNGLIERERIGIGREIEQY